MQRGARGRGSAINTPNRFERLHYEPLEIPLPEDEQPSRRRTVFYRDTSRSILARNDSPDLPFTYSINPYRGCEHGCVYCYARPSHEYLGFSAGLDFESRIMVKLDAARLLETALGSKGWNAQMVAFSGNTDCYQPVERVLGLTRQCLQVFLKFRNPVGLVTKNALVVRDLDILQEMARLNLIHVMISITSMRPELVQIMEPRTSMPLQRLEAIRALADRGIPVGVNAAPIIPGLTDEELPEILKRASDQGATSAGHILLRLPGPVKEIFLDWLRRNLPDRRSKILNRIRDTHGGELSDPRFCTRMSGEGEIASAIEQLFQLHAQKHGLAQRWCSLSTDRFVRTPVRGDLFDQA